MFFADHPPPKSGAKVERPGKNLQELVPARPGEGWLLSLVKSPVSKDRSRARRLTQGL